MLNLTDFSKFCNDKFHLRLKAQKLTETRKAPKIPISQIFLLVVGALALRKKSFLQIDLFSRRKEAKAWLGSQRRMVASDATLWRVLPTLKREELRSLVRQAYKLLRQQGHGLLTLPSGRKLRAAAIDGSALGGRYASAFEVLGAHAALIDLEPASGKGKELPASKKLLERVFEDYGQGFVDIVLGDGLYITQGMLRLCRRKLGTHLLVKTTELDSLLILQDAEALFNAPAEFHRDVVEYVRGVDLERGLSYEVWAAEGFHHTGFKDPLKVARVRTRPLKGKGKAEQFWIVSTDLSLTAEDLRELAHRRWSIENHGFRALNEAMNSKHVWTRGERAGETFETLMLMMFLSFLLTLAFHASVDKDHLWEKFRIRHLTLRYLAESLLLSLSEAAGLFALSG